MLSADNTGKDLLFSFHVAQASLQLLAEDELVLLNLPLLPPECRNDKCQLLQPVAAALGPKPGLHDCWVSTLPPEQISSSLIGT